MGQQLGVNWPYSHVNILLCFANVLMARFPKTHSNARTPLRTIVLKPKKFCFLLCICKFTLIFGKLLQTFCNLSKWQILGFNFVTLILLKITLFELMYSPVSLYVKFLILSFNTLKQQTENVGFIKNMHEQHT